MRSGGKNYDIRQCDSCGRRRPAAAVRRRRLRQKTGADVWTLGLPAQSGLHSAETLEEVPAYDVLVLPVPASPDGTTVPAPFGKAALPLETLAAHGKPGALVLGGACGGILPWLESRGLAAADYLRREELCLANAVPSAEGAIQIAMEETAGRCTARQRW